MSTHSDSSGSVSLLVAEEETGCESGDGTGELPQSRLPLSYTPHCPSQHNGRVSEFLTPVLPETGQRSAPFTGRASGAQRFRVAGCVAGLAGRLPTWVLVSPWHFSPPSLSCRCHSPKGDGQNVPGSVPGESSPDPMRTLDGGP